TYLLLIPLEEGNIVFPKSYRVEVGELQNGEWKTLERMGSLNALKIDSDLRFTPLILYTDKPPEKQWIERILLP
ncbi:MAG: hypothetical protein ACPL7E_03255, partial [bacterium]